MTQEGHSRATLALADPGHAHQNDLGTGPGDSS